MPDNTNQVLSGAARIRAGFFTGMLLLLLVSTAVVIRTAALEKSAHAVTHTQAVFRELDGVALSASAAENAFWQFVSGADDANLVDSELATARDALAAEARHESALRKLVAGDPVQRSNLMFLSELLRRHRDALMRGPDTRENRSRGLAELQHNQTGRDILATVVHMSSEERRFLESATARQQAILDYSRWVFGVATTAAFLLLAFGAVRMTSDFHKRTAAEQALAARDEQYRQVVELAGDIIYRTDREGRFTFCNPVALSTLHYTEGEVFGRSYLKLVRQDKRRETQRFYLRQFVRNQKSTYHEFPIIDGHGRERWIGQNVQLVLDEGRPVGFQAIARDITDRKRTEAELERSRNFVERIALATPGVLYVYDLDQRRNVFSNREVLNVLGYGPDAGQDVSQLLSQVHPDDQPMINAHYDAMRKAQDGEIRRLEIRVRHADGHWVWLSGRETPFERRGGLVRQVVGISQDITTRKAAQERLTYQANYDALTGLANRHHFWTRLQGSLRRASIEHSAISLCLFDVDHFKDINDRFGHAAGDEVLEAVGNIVRGELRPVDIAGRPGGDEFCFALPGTDSDEAARVAERIRERLSTMAFGLDAGSPFSVSATFGVAESTRDMDAKHLMEAADRALYRAKSAGRNRVCVDV